METVKDFLDYLKKTDTKILNYNDFLGELKNTPERDSTGTLETSILTPKEGLISIDTFLENLFTYEGQGHFLTYSEIKELENDTTNYTYDNDKSYLTNKDSFLAHDIHMKMFLNSDGNYLVFLQVNTGTYTKDGFSSYVALKVDDKRDYENAFLYDSTTYYLAKCLIKTQEGTTLNIEVISRPFEYYANMYVMNDDTREEIFNTDIYCTDLSSIKDEVNNYVNSNRELAKNFHIKEFTDYNGTSSIL